MSTLLGLADNRRVKAVSALLAGVVVAAMAALTVGTGGEAQANGQIGGAGTTVTQTTAPTTLATPFAAPPVRATPWHD